MERFEVLAEIGAGAYGRAVHARRRSDGAFAAIKEVRRQRSE